MGEREGDVSDQPAADASEEVERLDQKADELRADLDDTLTELERRGHAAAPFIKPVAVGLAVIAAVALGVKAWRRWRGR